MYMETNMRTLEELLAGVFLKESFVSDGASQVVNHQFEDWFDLVLIITSIVAKLRVLYFVSIAKE